MLHTLYLKKAGACASHLRKSILLPLAVLMIKSTSTWRYPKQTAWCRGTWRQTQRIQTQRQQHFCRDRRALEQWALVKRLYHYWSPIIKTLKQSRRHWSRQAAKETRYFSCWAAALWRRLSNIASERVAAPSACRVISKVYNAWLRPKKCLELSPVCHDRYSFPESFIVCLLSHTACGR